MSQHERDSSLQTSLVIPKEQVPDTWDRIRRVEKHRGSAVFAILPIPELLSAKASYRHSWAEASLETAGNFSAAQSAASSSEGFSVAA